MANAGAVGPAYRRFFDEISRLSKLPREESALDLIGGEIDLARLAGV